MFVEQLITSRSRSRPIGQALGSTCTCTGMRVACARYTYPLEMAVAFDGALFADDARRHGNLEIQRRLFDARLKELRQRYVEVRTLPFDVR